MWYWQCGPFWGLWWIFPLMFIFCMAVMFFVMRGLFHGRFPCGSMMDRAEEAGRCRGMEKSGASGKEGR